MSRSHLTSYPSENTDFIQTRALKKITGKSRKHLLRCASDSQKKLPAKEYDLDLILQNAKPFNHVWSCIQVDVLCLFWVFTQLINLTPVRFQPKTR